MFIKKLLVLGLLLVMAASAASAQDEDTFALCIRGGSVFIVSTAEDCDLYLKITPGSWREAIEELLDLTGEEVVALTTPDLTLPVPNLDNIAQLSTLASASASGGGVGVSITQQGGGQTTVTISSGQDALTILEEINGS